MKHGGGYQQNNWHQENSSPRAAEEVLPGALHHSSHKRVQHFNYGFSHVPSDPAVSPSATSMLVDCEHCHQQVFVHDLKKHVSHYHGHLMPFCCSLCGKGCLSSASLRFHMQAHAGRMFICLICDSKFKLKHHLKAHLKRIHQLDQCRKCLATFQDVQEYNQHLVSCL